MTAILSKTPRRNYSGLKLLVLMYTILVNFGTFTWVKMDEPSIEGLKLALQDGDVSVNRNMENPNKLPTYFIGKIGN